jgi:hypothetical protein
LVITPLAGVPSAGVVNVGLVKVLFVRVSVVALPTRVSVVVGRVSVGVPATAGAEIVAAPLVSPEITTDAIYIL